MRAMNLLPPLLLLAGVASAGTVARVVSVEGKTVTVEVLEGGLSDTESVDLWTAGGRRVVTLTVPSGYVERGLRAGLSFAGATPTAGAIVTQKGQVASWVEARAALARFPPGLVARVVSVEGATATLQVLVGAITANAVLDLLTPRGRSPATVSLPPGIDLVMSGETVKGFTVTPGPAVGAVLSDRARFETPAEALAFAPNAAPTPSPAPPTPSRPCPWTPAELSAALGFTVGPAQSVTTPFAGGSQLTCAYRETKGLRSVSVSQTEMTVGDSAANAKRFRGMLAGRLEPVPGDADGAAWQVDQGDLTEVTLHWWRNNVGTEVRVGGVDRKDRAAVAAMRRKVLTLRRP